MIPVLGVPTMTRKDLCQRMLYSIDHPVADVIVVDNKPDDWSPVVPDCVERVHHIRLPANLGVAGSWNLIIKVAFAAEHWLITNDDVVFEPGALAKVDEMATNDAIQFLTVSPRWAAFVLGEKVVEKVGLFCEGFHPAYFEDNDFERRAHDQDVPTYTIPAVAHHDNSSTLKSGFDILNHKTYRANSELFALREKFDVQDDGHWDLATRRDLSWD